MKRIETQPSLADRTYQAILDEICEGALPAGTHLVQEQLAAQLGVSRQPIQQAMALLKSDGLVEEAPGRGLRVTALDVARMRQHYEIRGALDRLAARMTAERVAETEAFEDRVRREGEAIMAAGKAAVASGAIADMIGHDVDFHGFLYDRSGNPLMRATAEPHWRFLRRVMGDVLRHAETPDEIWRQHQAILDAVLMGDADLAEQRAAAQIDNAADLLEAAFGDDGSPEKDAGRRAEAPSP
jgi:DNA-binding GntR family transcriptional regulator